MLVTKNYFQRIPFIRISSLFLVGIVLNHYLQIDFQGFTLIVFLLISMLILSCINNRFSKFKALDVLLSICILLLGFFYSARTTAKHLNPPDQNQYYLAEICQKPLEKANTFQSILRLQNNQTSVQEKVIAYFSKVGFDSTLLAGDQLVIFSKPMEIKNMGNPFEFDYRGMMHNKGIEYSMYLPHGSYKKTGIEIKRLSYMAEKVRDKLLLLLTRSSLQKEERAVLSALTLGYRSELDPETLDYFVNTGTIHVLSVSGLHVALIFFILSFLFSGIKTGKVGTIIYTSLMILFLWFYAFITGFSPPVQRSTVMFTFVIIGSVIRRPINIYNSLFASAMVLVLVDPNVLFDVGFQLSYLALLGIVMLQPPIAKLVVFKNKIIIWAWTLLTVSLSAQFITFPLSILYFNQFPNLFWISNFFVIPATTLLIWISFAFFAFTPIPFISNLLAQVIQIAMSLLLSILKWMSDLPLAVTRGIVLTPIQTWIIYGIIGALIIYSFSKHKIWLLGGMMLLICFQTSLLIEKSKLFNQKIVCVYNSKNKLIHLINGRGNYIVLSGRNGISEKENEMILNVCNHLQLKKPHYLKLTNNQHFSSNDLNIKDKTFRFLTCAMKNTNQLEFKTRNIDLEKFKIDNPQWVENKKTYSLVTLPVVFDKEEFSIDIQTNLKKSVFITLK